MYNSFVVENIGGNCPVQAEGRIDGKYFYFRARGAQWTFSVGESPDQAIGREGCFFRSESYGSNGEAGWMDLEEAHAFLLDASAAYYRQKREMAAQAAARLRNAQV